MTPQSLANSYRERSNGDIEAALDAACEALIEARVALEALAGNVTAPDASDAISPGNND